MADVRSHAALEGELTDALLASTDDTRAAAFATAYTRLYTELPWLNASEASVPEADLRLWERLIGRGRRVLEIGSGHGDLVTFLSRIGNDCTATEITPSRGASLVDEEARITWAVADGVHLTRFFEQDHFDVVISDQVFEHLHPDDHHTHLAEACRLLRPGGRYILRTPHRSVGPEDLSAVFGLDAPVFMHLHEADYVSLSQAMRRAGFASIGAVFGNTRFNVARASRLFFAFQHSIDRLEAAFIPTQGGRRRFRRLARKALVHPYVWIVGRR